LSAHPAARGSNKRTKNSRSQRIGILSESALVSRAYG
jgi:hypothetical protein